MLRRASSYDCNQDNKAKVVLIWLQNGWNVPKLLLIDKNSYQRSTRPKYDKIPWGRAKLLYLPLKSKIANFLINPTVDTKYQ